VSLLQVLVEAARESLDSKGSIFYVGTGGPGLVGLIDASEQVPTFGAAPADVQAFVEGGWRALKGRAMKRMPSTG
jgi:N-acetylmuramic acid 6-phosphate (MurNAc-6-P) etherase